MKLGKAFSDGVVSESKISRGDDRDSKPSWWMGVGRILFLTCLFLVCMFILLTRLFYLTLIDGHRYRVLSDTNRIRELVRHAPRGILLDRTGKALAANIPRYRMEELCSTAETQVCTRTLPKEEGDRLIAQGLPAGSFLEVDYERDYPYGSNLSHVIGYTGELDEEELRDGYYVARNYKRGDRIGRVGAEAVYEEKLRGRDGRELVEIDASGKILRTLGIDQEVPGEDVTLSIDAELNSAAGSAFPSGKKGAIVVAKPLTGEILALYSSPTFSPERFSQGLRADEYIDLVENPDQPLFDRAIGGVYPPGSTFKLVTALAALEEKAVDEHTLVQDIGVIRIGSKFSFPNWYFLKYGKTDGNVDIVKGLQRSNDIYFYKAGEFLGISKLAKWAHTVGIGKPLGIEIGGEASGLMPDPAWKNDRFASPADLEARNNAWYLGDTYHIAIGQGYLLVSPLQVNAWTNIIANQGKICRPTIKKREAGSLPAQAG
ncbi:MAG: penicillin-binding transpeptidase domain-containing protein, partial [bacterium]|nr:penicillin-binding transpeptidase domain-containing protein [bacterium]